MTHASFLLPPPPRPFPRPACTPCPLLSGGLLASADEASCRPWVWELASGTLVQVRAMAVGAAPGCSMHTLVQVRVMAVGGCGMPTWLQAG